MKVRSELILLSVMIASALLVGCTAAPDAKTPEELEEVTLKLKWVHQAQFAGNYAAKERGFYRDEGLDVEILPFTFEDPTIEAVLSGEADFGITGADALLLEREKGSPLKAVAVIYKVNPVVAYSLKESNITKPEHLIGRRVGLEDEMNVRSSYYTMLSRMGINRSLITEVEIGYDATELLEGRTDVSTGYIINEPHQAIEKGYEINTILMAEYGVNTYADVIFTTEGMIENDPELVGKFVKATIKGWRYAIENEDEAVDIVLKYAKDRTFSHELYMLQSSIPLIDSGIDDIGVMRAESWRNLYSILLEQGMLEGQSDPESAYTNEFIR